MDAAISQTIAPFTYDTLPDAAKYIRLLEVLDDEYSEDIRVRCRITTWLVEDTPSYYAISYTWGDPESGSTILINGQAFRIRTNCEFVLKQAYWYKKTSYYWVDAICINQTHLEEKSLQVSMMGNIYKQAAQVLACVGDHADDSAFLFHKLKQHAFTKRSPFAKRLYRTGYAFGLSLRFQLGQGFSTTMRFIHAVFCLTRRPYFTRLWILQELRNAQEAIFLCGSDAIPRRFIHQMLQGMDYHLRVASIEIPRVNVLRRLPIIRRFYSVKIYHRDWCVHHGRDESLWKTVSRARDLVDLQCGVFETLSAALGLECQDRKDKIFGLISSIDWGTSGPLIPDYTQTDFEAVVSFFKALLNAWYQGGASPAPWHIPFLSFIVVCMLKLDDKSPGVPSAVEARRIEPEICLANEEINLEHMDFHYPVWPGWRVSSGHLNKSQLGFSTWSLPGSGLGEMYLPFWVQDGDWIVMEWTGNLKHSSFVLVRDVVEGLGGPLIGHAIRHQAPRVFHPKKAPGANFRIYWDPEDLVFDAIMQEQLGPWGKGPRPESNEWVRLLNTAICRKETPGSSYALRCDCIYCLSKFEKGYSHRQKRIVHRSVAD